MLRGLVIRTRCSDARAIVEFSNDVNHHHRDTICLDDSLEHGLVPEFCLVRPGEVSMIDQICRSSIGKTNNWSSKVEVPRLASHRSPVSEWECY